MKYVVGAVAGLTLGAAIAWAGAFANDMLSERALLLMEIAGATGLIVGLLIARRWGRKPTHGLSAQ